MNSKDHIIALALVERELGALSDAEFETLIASCTPEAIDWFKSLSGGEIAIAEIRGAIRRGRLKGMPDRVALILTDPCLQDCIAALGTKADFPNYEELDAVTPPLVTKHGLATTRLMYASAVLGQAPASAVITKLLKSPTYKAI